MSSSACSERVDPLFIHGGKRQYLEQGVMYTEPKQSVAVGDAIYEIQRFYIGEQPVSGLIEEYLTKRIREQTH